MIEYFRKRKIKKLVKEAGDYLSHHYRESSEDFREYHTIKEIIAHNPNVEFSFNFDDEKPIRSGNIQFDIDIYSIDENPDTESEEERDKETGNKDDRDIKTDSSEIKEPESEDFEFTDPEHYFGGIQSKQDYFDADKFLHLMSNYKKTKDIRIFLQGLEENKNRTFVQCVSDWINKKYLNYPAVYKAAQIDRRLFSKIMSDNDYKPAKDTAIAICFGLKLKYAEAVDLLQRAGYSLSHSDKRDIIIEYFLEKKKYKLDDLNAVLYELGQKTIGR